MAHARWLRALALAVTMGTLGVGCQAVFGDFHIDDSAFDGSGGSSGSNGNKGGNDGKGGDTVAQTGPILLMPTEGLYTTEWGGQAKFSIVLDHQPKAPVTVALVSSNLNEGTVSPASVTFNDKDWNAPQVVTVTGVDDTLPDPNHPYQVVTQPATSDDPSFAGKDPIDLSLVNVDNESAGVTVVPTTGLVTSESGVQDTFSVVLNSKPAKDVTIALTSSNPAEGTVSPASLLFNDMNWMAPQIVTVTGVDDTEKDGAKAFTVATAVSSEDPTYASVAPVEVSVTNLDNETAGITVNLITGIDPNDSMKLRTSESGDTATFTVQLNAQPNSEVSIPVSTSSKAEAEASPSALTFTKLNWNAPQTVTVMGVDDDSTADGDQPYTIVLGTPTTEDPEYTAVEPVAVPASNVDNDRPGFTLALVSGIDPKDTTKLLTSESQTAATFSLVLNSKPLKPVSVAISSSLPSEGSVSPTTLNFTADNWKAPQIVTVKGVDDAMQDGSPVFFVRTAAATSEDQGYAGIDPPDVQVTNEDNDSAGFRVVLATGIDPQNATQLATTESGGTATFTIALTSQPNDDVSIALVSSNVKEGTVSPKSLTFTKVNYGAPQTVTVTGVDDSVADGNQNFVIAVGAGASKDVNFDQKFGTQVKVVNRDNDSAGIVVTPVTGLVTSESGKTDKFTVVLNSQPMTDVTIPISSNNTAEGIPNTSSLKFTVANWNAPQTVTVTGVQDDDTADGDQAYKIVTGLPTTTDNGYKLINPDDVSVTNRDDDSPGIIVTPTSGLSTTEAGGTASFTVVLQSRPKNSAMVTIKLTSNRPGEGSVSPATLTFNNLNYKSAQTVTVTGVDDKVADGPQPYLIVTGAASSADAAYNNYDPPDVSVTNVDNDSAGVLLAPAPTELPAMTTEKGGTSTFTVVLNSQPTAPVTFTLTSTNPAEGVVSPASLTFTAVNWNAPQTVTVTGQNDDVADGDQLFKVKLSAATSTDGGYGGKFAVDVPFANQDDDHPGLLVTAAGNLQTKETGSSVTFTVALLSKPTAGVSVALSSTNTAEGTVAPASLAFTTANWATAQTVTVTGVNDDVADGPQGYSVKLANAVSTDPNYGGKYGTQLELLNIDDDQPGFVLAGTTNLQTTEAGGKATFTVALLSRPSGSNTVTLPLSSSNTKEGTVSPAQLLFTTANWSMPQTVTVTGVDDSKSDGTQVYAIVFAPATSADAGYANKAPGPVSISNADDDGVATITVTPTTCSTTPGTTATFTIGLSSQPGDSVSIALSSDNTNEGTVDPASVTFTMDNWQTPQTVTVTGVNDGSMGAMVQYKIITGSAVSPGDNTGYSNYNVADVSCTNTTPTSGSGGSGGASP